MKKVLLAGVMMLVLLCSCEDFFQTYMQVPPPPYQEGIVVNLYVYDDDTVVLASVTRNTSSLGQIPGREDLLLQDATVQLLDEEGKVVVELDTFEMTNTAYYDTFFVYDNSGNIRDTIVYPRQPGARMVNYRATLSAPFGGNGKQFTLQVNNPAYGTVSSVQKMPAKPVITQPVWNPDAGSDDYGGDYATIHFDIVDPPEENYYQVMVYFIGTDGVRVYLDPETDDPLFQYSFGYQGLLLQDKTFNGGTYTVNLKMYYYMEEEGQDNTRVFVDVQSVSKDYYLYSRTLEKAWEMEDIGFFVEPVQVYDNIEHGYGIFAMNARTVSLASKEK